MARTGRGGQLARLRRLFSFWRGVLDKGYGFFATTFPFSHT